MSPAATAAPDVVRSRNAVAWAFVLNGVGFASLAARVPSVRAGLDLSNGGLGLLLLCVALGSAVGLPLSGRLIERLGTATVVRAGALTCFVGLSAAASGVTLGSAALAGAGLAAYGLGSGVWDVAMNVAGAEVERLLGRTVLPRFHAGWSIGSFAGAGLAVVLTRLSIPLEVHLPLVMGLAALACLLLVGPFPTGHVHDPEAPVSGSAWRELRTVLIGLMVLAYTLAEGSANDWLALAMIDGHHVASYLGAASFGLFVAAMTLGRLVGPVWLDRQGRLPVLLVSAVAAAGGIVLLVVGSTAVAVVGIVAWGLGAALGFPVGMSMAADDPARSARRVSVVSTIGYGAFLGGPPLLGFVGDHTGTLDSLLVVAALMVPAAALAVAAERR